MIQIIISCDNNKLLYILAQNFSIEIHIHKYLYIFIIILYRTITELSENTIDINLK